LENEVWLCRKILYCGGGDMSRWGKFQDVADLPVRAFNESKYSRTYEGGGGGGGQNTTTQVSLSPEQIPYFEQLMAESNKEYLRPYSAYTGDTIAGFSPDQTTAMQGIYALQTPSEMAAASAGLANAATAAQGLQSYTPTTFGTSYAPTGVTSGYTATAATPGYQAGTFDTATAQAMMDPYMRNVLDVQKAEAMKEFQRGKAGRAAQAVQAGAFGGGRFGAEEAVAESEMLDRMANIEATGMQTAYQQAREQFGAEQAMQQQAGQMGLTAQQQTEAAKQQQEQFAQSAAQMTEGQEQFAANMAQQVATSQEAANQFAATYGQQGVQLSMQVAQAQEQLGNTQQAVEIARLNLQKATGAEEQALAQRELDRAEQDFINARDYNRNQLAFYNAMLRGIPVQSTSQTVQTASTAGLGTQLAGAGIAGLGSFANMG
jgi:hypothetical protein